MPAHGGAAAAGAAVEGQGLSEIGPQVGCSHQGVALIVPAGRAASGPPGPLGPRAGALNPGRNGHPILDIPAGPSPPEATRRGVF
jgi:hypothetical protein